MAHCLLRGQVCVPAPVLSFQAFELKVRHCAGAQLQGPALTDTRAGGDDDPYPLSFRNLDNRTYYMVAEEDGTDLLNYSGCGNTVSANDDVVRRLIVDSLRM